MVYALIMMAGIAGIPSAPAVPAAPRPPTIDARPGVPRIMETQQQELAQQLRRLAAMNPPLSRITPPCPAPIDLPLYGLMTLPVERYGICNPHYMHPQWYNLSAPKMTDPPY